MLLKYILNSFKDAVSRSFNGKELNSFAPLNLKLFFDDYTIQHLHTQPTLL